MRRKVFFQEGAEVAHQILDSARIGHVASVTPEGIPEVLPFNYVRVGEELIMHGSPKGFLAKNWGRTVRFLAYDRVTWIPSTWRHPKLACPATTYYRSVSVVGKLESVQSLTLKAEFLQGFMERYQPEGGYKPIKARSKLYQGPLEALAVSSLPIKEIRCKVVMAQHLSEQQRRSVYEGLIQRDRPGDRECAEEILAFNPDFQPLVSAAR